MGADKLDDTARFNYICGLEAARTGHMAWLISQVKSAQATMAERHHPDCDSLDQQISGKPCNCYVLLRQQLAEKDACRCEAEVGFICDVCLLPKFRKELEAKDKQLDIERHKVEKSIEVGTHWMEKAKGSESQLATAQARVGYL